MWALGGALLAAVTKSRPWSPSLAVPPTSCLLNLIPGTQGVKEKERRIVSSLITSKHFHLVPTGSVGT